MPERRPQRRAHRAASARACRCARACSLVLVVLSAAGLLAADVATYLALRSFLFERVDRTLDTSAAGVSSSLATQGFRPGPGRAPRQRPASPGSAC